MPRERVVHGKIYPIQEMVEGEPLMEAIAYPLGALIPEGQAVAEDPSLEVSWTRDNGLIQIGVVMPLEMVKDLAKAGDESYPRDGVHSSIWVTAYDRRNINHLIRTLRRARDAAYGADE